MIEVRSEAYCKHSLMILLFNMYLSSVDQILGSFLHNQDLQLNETSEAHMLAKLSSRLGKFVRYTKYCMIMLEQACSNRARRQELIYRCHFDFIYIAGLNYLFSQLDSLISITKMETQTKDTLQQITKQIETAALQLAAFLPTLVMSVDQKQKNFAIIVRMKRQKFSVKCTSLSYKLIMETLLLEGAPVCELETLEVHKVGKV